jgi:hypothetical protein
MNKIEVWALIEKNWQILQETIATWSPTQIDGPTDAAGWTIKDHLMHLADWEDGITGLLAGESRPGRMGLSDAEWENHDIDTINEILRQRHLHKPWPAVMEALRTVHANFLYQLDQLTDEDLQRSYGYFSSRTSQTAQESREESPVLEYIIGNTAEHYEEHIPWMKAILGED